MRKYIIGILIGVALTISASAFANDVKSLVGKAIQGEFTVTYESEQLDQKAIVIDGASYLPVKAIADSLDLDATFDKNTGIEIKHKEGVSVASNVEVSEKSIKLEDQKNSAQSQRDIIDDLLKQQKDETNEEKKKEIQGWINFQQTKLNSLIDSITELETE